MNKKLKKIVALGILLISLGGVFLITKSPHASEINNKSEVVNSEDSNFVEFSTPVGLIENFAKDNNITFEEAEKYFPSDIFYEDRSPGITYKVFSRTLNTTRFFYHPTVRIYAKMRNGNFDTVYRADMVRGDVAFRGSIYTNLESGDRLYYIAQGDFYSHATTTVSAGINIGIGQAGSVNFSVSHTNNHYAYLYMDGHFYKWN